MNFIPDFFLEIVMPIQNDSTNLQKTLMPIFMQKILHSSLSSWDIAKILQLVMLVTLEMKKSRSDSIKL